MQQMLGLPSISSTNTEVEIPARQKNGNHVEVDLNGQRGKRTKCPGIRIVGNRIYDSQNGKTCHQCRQKTRDFAASCKNLKKRKICTIKFCHKCLMNRYGEKAEEMEQLGDWKCPKCRGICNCSCCMKRRGQKPTGQLVYTAKASGFSSVSAMLDVRAPEDLELGMVNNVAVLPKKEATLEKEQMIRVDNSSSEEVLMSNTVSPKKSIASKKELAVILSGNPGKENSLDENSGLKFDSLQVQKASHGSKETPKKTKREGLKEILNGNRVDDACENKKFKRPKICNEVPEVETKKNASDVIEVCKEVSEKEREVNSNHAIIHVEKKFPQTWASEDVSFNPSQNDMEEEMTTEDCNGTAVIDDDDNAGVITSQTAIGMPQKVKKIEDEVPLPTGTMLTDILDIEFQPDDVGNALQFLEFCRVFGKVLDVKKGEAEAILEELVHKQILRRGTYTLAVNFHIRVLTLILSQSGEGSLSLTTTKGKNSWLKALENLISECDLVLKDFQLDCLKEGICGYYDLDLSKKLRLLNFLCDEALGTEKMRSYIDDQNLRFAENLKETKAKVAAAKEKEKCLKQKLQDELAQAIIARNGIPLSILEHDALLSKIKSETAKAHAEMLEAKDTVPKRKQRSDALRTEPVFLDSSGHAFWKLHCYDAEYAVLMQDVKMQDAASAAADERWFVYGLEKKHEVDKYISSRTKRPRMQISYK